ncbi:unnamed protein product [Polarella glacialis]|uniref:Uncharacterized protein n=1 Tax=Polarella glacialis TaxID=89957 RepID=A0A813GUA9_POLGL|nr:unnamed protein product [Polarella glacialis]
MATVRVQSRSRKTRLLVVAGCILCFLSLGEAFLPTRILRPKASPAVEAAGLSRSWGGPAAAVSAVMMLPLPALGASGYLGSTDSANLAPVQELPNISGFEFIFGILALLFLVAQVAFEFAAKQGEKDEPPPKKKIKDKPFNNPKRSDRN